MATKIVSLLTTGNYSHQESSENVNKVRTQFFSAGPIGPISLNTGSGGTGAFAVSAQSTANNSLRVTQGEANVIGTPSGGNSQTFSVNMNAYEDITILPNASGGSLYDWIYIALDPAKLLNPASDASNVATLLVSRSTLNTSDNGVPPAYGLLLAVVTVANGFTTLANSTITDKRIQSGANAIAPTIFSAGVQSQANAGTAAGTSYYTNLGGIKLCWGITSGSLSTSATPAPYTVTLPTGFFTTIQGVTVSAANMTTVQSQYASVTTITATTLTVSLISTAAGTLSGFSYFIIGT